MRAFDRITQKPGVMGGKACIRGMRVTAAMVVNQIGAGRTIEAVLADYPYLEREDVLQALQTRLGSLKEKTSRSLKRHEHESIAGLGA